MGRWPHRLGNSPNADELPGVSGGVLSEVQGGKFGAGFLASSFSSVGDSFLPDMKYGNVVKAAVIGGTASVLGGGKFENGAVTGAFVGLFNAGGSKSGGKRPHELSRQDLYNNAEILGAYGYLPDEYHYLYSMGEFTGALMIMQGTLASNRASHNPFWPGTYVCHQCVDTCVLSLPGNATFRYWDITPYNGSNPTAEHSVVLFEPKGVNPMSSLYADPFVISTGWFRGRPPPLTGDQQQTFGGIMLLNMDRRVNLTASGILLTREK